DGRVDAAKLLEGARAAAARLVAADFAAVAEHAAGPIAPALFGALAASGALPFQRAQFEEAIRRGGVGVPASLKAFAAGYAAALAPTPEPQPPLPTVRLGPRLAALGDRIAREFPPAAQDTLRHAVLRLADYQDVPYAAAYLDL